MKRLLKPLLIGLLIAPIVAGVAHVRPTQAADGELLTAAGLGLTLPSRAAVEIPLSRLFSGFLDTSYAYRFGPPSHEVVVARLVEPMLAAAALGRVVQADDDDLADRIVVVVGRVPEDLAGHRVGEAGPGPATGGVARQPRRIGELDVEGEVAVGAQAAAGGAQPHGRAPWAQPPRRRRRCAGTRGDRS